MVWFHKFLKRFAVTERVILSIFWHGLLVLLNYVTLLDLVKLMDPTEDDSGANVDHTYLLKVELLHTHVLVEHLVLDI